MTAPVALDLDKFDKVRSLMTGGATPGERFAAKTCAEAMARAAGLTFAKACTKADMAKAKPAPIPRPASPAESFVAAMNAMMNTPEAKAERAERETKRQARCRELLETYGSEDAVWADTPEERILREACRPIIRKRDVIGGQVDTLAGWNGVYADMPQEVREVISIAIPMPTAVAGVWAERRAWDQLYDDRAAFDPATDHWIWARARTYILEAALDTMPAGSFDDVLARISWMDAINDQGWSRDCREDAVLLTTLRADVERMAVQSGRGNGVPGSEAPSASASVQSGHGTAAERRRAVVAMLANPATASLPDREIARRVGVSPTTVGKLRRSGGHT